MEARYAIRKHQLLEECQVAPASFDQVMPRLSTCMTPLSRPCRGKPSRSMPRPMSAACCRMWNAKTSNPLLIMLGKTAWDCKVSSAGPTGPMLPAPDGARPSGPAIGTRRWRVGVRSLGVSQIWSRVGGRGSAVVRPFGESRQLSSGHLPGLRLGPRPHPG